jgi:hypothetical protein
MQDGVHGREKPSGAESRTRALIDFRHAGRSE